MTTVALIDGYIDEPTCLGVPPYISPYPRYITGAIKEINPGIKISYHTIDQIREQKSILKRINQANIVIIIAGMTVPGRYLSGRPLQPNELKRILVHLNSPKKILCGPAARYGFGIAGGKKTKKIMPNIDNIDLIITGDPEIVIADIIKNNIHLHHVNPSKKRSHSAAIGTYATEGATIVSEHPYFPSRLIAEIETYRGCPRFITNGCSFCIEPQKGPPDFRPISQVISEIKALYQQGIRHFRIGNQPCLFSYQAKDATTKEIPIPNPAALEQLFSGIHKVAPRLETLHIDNVNPGVVAKYPEESAEIMQTIIQYHTPGDVAAFGVESLDPEVIKQNNLKANEHQIFQAINLFNEIGKKRGNNGLPHLLPGINFVLGLKGETKKTYTINYDFLKKIIEKNLIVRRINIRQVIPIPGTRMEQTGNNIIRKHKKLFQHFKYNVAHTIEQPLLQKMVPKGIILTDVICELWRGKTTFGRQLGSYPLLVGIPGKYPIHQRLNVCVIDHGYRSITALPYPAHINTAPRETIEHLPGIGKKRAIRILLGRPFSNKEQFIECLDDQTIAQNTLHYISFQQ